MPFLCVLEIMHELTRLFGLLSVLSLLHFRCSHACFGSGQYTAGDAQYCRSNVNDCLRRACNEINKYTPPGCDDSRVKDQVRQRLTTCYDLNACFRDPITIGCTSTLSDCPMLHMCRQGKCWPQKISNFRCSSSYDCKNGVYECINNECNIRPFGDAGIGNTFSAPTPSYMNFYPSPGDLSICTSTPSDCPMLHMCRNGRCWPKTIANFLCYATSDCRNDIYECINSQCKIRPFGTSSVDDYIPMPTPIGQCRLSDECSPDQMCRQGQCWPKRIAGKYCQSSYDCFQNSLYECLDNQCRISGRTVHVSSNQIPWVNGKK